MTYRILQVLKWSERFSLSTREPERNSNNKKRKGDILKTKDYLKQAFRLHDLIRSNEKELKELQELSVSIPGTDYSKERVQTSGSHDARYTSIVIKICELEKMIQAEIDELLSLKIEIRDVINNVNNDEERLVLKYRYISFYTWESIADELNLSLRTVHRIHSDALRSVKVPKKLKIGTL